MPTPIADNRQDDDKTCRICRDDNEDDLGSLIRPCSCKGSLSVVHKVEQAFSKNHKLIKIFSINTGLFGTMVKQ